MCDFLKVKEEYALPNDVPAHCVLNPKGCCLQGILPKHILRETLLPEALPQAFLP